MSQHDLDVARKMFIDACKLRGSRLVFRHRITADDMDLDDISVPRCSKCYDGVYQDAADPECPVCYGTGFTGGYEPPVLTWGDMSDTLHELKWEKGIGYFRPDTGSGAMSAWYPALSELDVVWIVDVFANGEVVSVHDMFVLTGSVSNQYIKNRVPSMNDETVFWKWDFTTLPEDDFRRTLAFK